MTEGLLCKNFKNREDRKMLYKNCKASLDVFIETARYKFSINNNNNNNTNTNTNNNNTTKNNVAFGLCQEGNRKLHRQDPRKY